MRLSGDGVPTLLDAVAVTGSHVDHLFQLFFSMILCSNPHRTPGSLARRPGI
jgi:hypothetical protein